MTTKRFSFKTKTRGNQAYTQWYDNEKPINSAHEVIDLLNDLHKENELLKTQLQNTSAQRDEFHRGARENANRVGKLKKENEQLKKALLFFYDVANCECSANWKGDMEKGCKRFFNCTYEEAKEKYGDYDGMWWEIND